MASKSFYGSRHECSYPWNKLKFIKQFNNLTFIKDKKVFKLRNFI